MAAKTDPVAQKMSQASKPVTQTGTINPPKKGEKFRCEQCGMELEITADCKCQAGSHVEFACCGKTLKKL